jgi:hypothetical protein
MLTFSTTGSLDGGIELLGFGLFSESSHRLDVVPILIGYGGQVDPSEGGEKDCSCFCLRGTGLSVRNLEIGIAVMKKRSDTITRSEE